MDASSSTSLVGSSNEEKASGYSKLSEGKRHLLVGDIPEAVSTLALASELLAKQFGETHLECADAYFYYGKSLLDLARIENGVLGNALEGVPEDGDLADDSQVEDPEKMTDDEKSAVESKVKDALDYNYQTCELEKDKAEAADLSMDGEDSDEGGEAMEQESSATPVDQAPAMDESTTEDKTEETDVEPGNLQQSWEMFELAKIIYTREVSSCPEGKKVDIIRKICDALLHLGEISMENENFDQALEDLGECLKMRKENFPADSRSIAETFYQLGLAQAQSGKITDGEASLAEASEVLKTRLGNLQKMESSDFLSKEMADLDDLIKEVNDKIVDFGDMKTQVSKKLRDMSEQAGMSSDKPAATIAVKRKEASQAEAAAAV